MVFGSLAKVDFCTQVFQIFALIAITHRVSAYLCVKCFYPFYYYFWSRQLICLLTNKQSFCLLLQVEFTIYIIFYPGAMSHVAGRVMEIYPSKSVGP